MELEKKIRPDLDQMLTLKDQIAGKLQGWANGGKRWDKRQKHRFKNKKDLDKSVKFVRL